MFLNITHHISVGVVHDLDLNVLLPGPVLVVSRLEVDAVELDGDAVDATAVRTTPFNLKNRVWKVKPAWKSAWQI